MSRSDPCIAVDDAKLPGRIEVPRLTISQGQCVVLCGPNGSGKSSFLRMIAGLEPQARGSLKLGALDLLHAARAELAGQVAWLPQRPYLGEFITCESIVAAARFRFGEGPERALSKAYEILAAQGIAHLAPRPANQVSGGELQRVLIAALIAQDAPFLLVDEPANHLDPRHQVATYRRLGELWRHEGRTIILVTHDVRLVKLLGPPDEIRILGIESGSLRFETTLADPNLSRVLSELYGVAYVEPSLPGGLAIHLDEGFSEQNR